MSAPIESSRVFILEGVSVHEGHSHKRQSKKKVDFISVRYGWLLKTKRSLNLEQVEHHNDRSAAAELLPSRIIEQWRIDVGDVSGATSSSKVIQEAVYNALTGERTVRK